MKGFLAWFKPGVRIKRYIILQLIAIGVLCYSLVSLFGGNTINPQQLVAYIALITISLFLTVFSFLLAQRNILKMTLKNMAQKDKTLEIKKLITTEDALNKGPKIVVIGGGKGLSNLLSSLKEYTNNLTAIVAAFDDGTIMESGEDVLNTLPIGDIKNAIIALSPYSQTMEQLLAHKVKDTILSDTTFGTMMVATVSDIVGGLSSSVQYLSQIYNMKGKILPVSLDKSRLCAGLENGDIVVGESNIRPRVIDSKSRIKQVFLKDTIATPAPGVLEAIHDADVIVLGPGSLYTSVISCLLVDEVSKAIASSKAKRVLIANIMNEPGETQGFTLARHVNEVERYLDKHILDYVIANNGEITEDMILDFNQGRSTPVTIDMENIQNRTISVIQEDLVITAPNSIYHDSVRLSEIILNIANTKSAGSMNLLKQTQKAKHKSLEKKITSNETIEKRDSSNAYTAKFVDKLKKIKFPSYKTNEDENK